MSCFSTQTLFRVNYYCYQISLRLHLQIRFCFVNALDIFLYFDFATARLSNNLLKPDTALSAYSSKDLNN